MEEYISVIIPVLNRKDFLNEALKSVLDQSHKNFELIVIDDASNDDLYGLIKSFNDNRIIYIKNKINKGVSFSRNIGIKKAKYDYIALLDSDDRWQTDKLALQLKFFQNNPGLNVCHTEEIWIRLGKRVNQKKIHKKSGGDIFIPSLRLCLMSPSSIILKKNIFKKYGLFDETMPVCEDYDMWLRITANEQVGFIDIPLVIKYGGHDDQLSRSYPAMDKFRVMSMMRILKNTQLSNIKKKALINEIKYKSKILLNGAVKRGRNKDADLYRDWLASFPDNNL